MAKFTILEGCYLLVGAGEALAHDLALEGSSLLQGEVLVILRQPRLALLVHEKDEADPHPSFVPFPGEEICKEDEEKGL